MIERRRRDRWQSTPLNVVDASTTSFDATTAGEGSSDASKSRWRPGDVPGSNPTIVAHSGEDCRDVNAPRNVSCPVSPIGSPLLHPRSPQYMSGRMSPSPISSPRITSGASTPLTGGGGAIPFQHLKQPTTYLNDGTQMTHRSQNYTNGSMRYHEPKPDLFRGIPDSSHNFRDIVSSENVAHRVQFWKPDPGQQRESCDVRRFCRPCVSAALDDHTKLNPPMDLHHHL